MKSPRLNLALPLATLLALSACQGEKKAQDQRTAVGEILPGSVSDAMLPYDSLRSQPPLAPTAEGTAGAKPKRSPGAGRATEAEAAPGDASESPSTPAAAADAPAGEAE